MNNSEILSMWQIDEMKKECFQLTFGCIDTIFICRGWSHDYCLVCSSTVYPKILDKGCPSWNKVVTEAAIRFKVEVRFKHHGDEATFVMWDRDCIQLLIKIATKLRKELIDISFRLSYKYY